MYQTFKKEGKWHAKKRTNTEKITHGSLAAAMAMVAIWDRSPHSAKKVRVKDWVKIAVAAALAAAARPLCPFSSSPLSMGADGKHSLWKWVSMGNAEKVEKNVNL